MPFGSTAGTSFAGCCRCRRSWAQASSSLPTSSRAPRSLPRRSRSGSSRRSSALRSSRSSFARRGAATHERDRARGRHRAARWAARRGRRRPARSRRVSGWPHRAERRGQDDAAARGRWPRLLRREPSRCTTATLRRCERRERAQQIAVVPQEPATPAWLTVAEYVLLGRTPYLGTLAREGRADRDAAARALDAARPPRAPRADARHAERRRATAGGRRPRAGPGGRRS